jgi:hypothetical protein
LGLIAYLHLLVFIYFVMLFKRSRRMDEIFKLEMLKLFRSIDRTLSIMLEGTGPSPKARRAEFFLINDDGQEQRMVKMIVKADAKPKKFRVRYKDSLGNPAPVDGMPALTLLNADLGIAKATLNVVDGEVGVFEGELSFLGVVGQTQINLVADPNLGAEVEELVAQSELVDVVAAQASVAEIEFLAEGASAKR